MIAMKMADKNVVDAVEVCLETHQLHLGSLSAIHQEVPVLDLDKLRGGKPPICRQSAAGSEYGDLKTQLDLPTINEKKQMTKTAFRSSGSRS
jgi:hypothetical protein